MTKDEALRLALEALKNSQYRFAEYGYQAMQKTIDGNKEAITAIKAALEAKNEKPCPEFWDWLPKAYRHGDVGDEPRFTKYNMEVAFLAGKQSAALKAKDEPVAAWELFDDGWDSIADPEWMESLPVGTKLYTTPPQRTWEGLTDEDLFSIYNQTHWNVNEDWNYERAIEAKLKEKNS